MNLMQKKEKMRQRRRIAHQMYPLGTRLTATTKGKQVFAEVVHRGNKTAGILFNGVVYKSMSGAADAATGGHRDGWDFWKPI